MAESGIRPPFQDKPADDVTRFLWALSWADDPGYIELSAPVYGCIVVMTRSGGGHVTFYVRTEGSYYVCRGGNQSDAVTEASYSKSDVVALMWPRDVPVPEVPPEDRPELRMGSRGPEVESVQRSLGIPVDGDFGGVTDSAVKGYQAAYGLGVDGVVGEATWAALDDLDARVAEGTDGLSPEMIGAITDVAENSSIAGYSWRDRGRAPAGYISGVACCYALAYDQLNKEHATAKRMARADTNSPDKDALTWYRDQFQSLGMDNSRSGADTLRHLFVMILGLGMRESSGRYCEGRDMSASNVSADTAEAGLFQTSWNIRSCDSTIPPLLPNYWNNPNGFLPTFRDGVSPSSSELGNYGSGDGAQYQFLSKFAPAFHTFVTALGMRSLRQHWGPINREEVELRKEADTLFKQVQSLIDDGVEPLPPDPEPPEPEPEPEVNTITITIDPPGSSRVVVIGGSE
jgi:peptidoglycan hydrolase-like protein with peptidoglycan-binding domain